MSRRLQVQIGPRWIGLACARLGLAIAGFRPVNALQRFRDDLWESPMCYRASHSHLHEPGVRHERVSLDEAIEAMRQPNDYERYQEGIQWWRDKEGIQQRRGRRGVYYGRAVVDVDKFGRSVCPCGYAEECGIHCGDGECHGKESTESDVS